MIFENFDMGKSKSRTKAAKQKFIPLPPKMQKKADIISQLNEWGRQKVPFVFLFDFAGKNPIIFPLNNPLKEVFWTFPASSNSIESYKKNELKSWKTTPVSFEKFSSGFNQVMWHIHNGDTYLLNFTQPTCIETNLSLEEIFLISSAPYKIYLKDKFVCFSPETFVKICDGKIYSYPMKGTIDAGIENAEQVILTDSKEIAEHNTIVDLIRNDLSLVAENVVVEKFRYLSHIQTNNKNLWQVSSEISGELPKNYSEKIGDILFTLLPAGSISGAPKKKTLEIIEKTENYERGFYTGVFGIFDGENLDSCVLIRFIENQNGQLVYKSGGGITFMSEAEKEYDEMLKKVYVPVV
jgi:para-aminobenzoate synthetase component 1